MALKDVLRFFFVSTYFSCFAAEINIFLIHFFLNVTKFVGGGYAFSIKNLL